MTITDTPLSIFDTNVVAPLNGSGPGARRADPIASHVAADKAEASAGAVKAIILTLIFEAGSMTGQELNDLYRERWEKEGWPQVAYDSPRKRAGDMFRARQLSILNETEWRDGRGEPAEYTLLGVRS